MEKTIKRELKAIENKFNEMVEECRNVEEAHKKTEQQKCEEFILMLNEVRCCFDFGEREDLASITQENHDYVLVAISLRKCLEIKQKALTGDPEHDNQYFAWPYNYERLDSLKGLFNRYDL